MSALSAAKEMLGGELRDVFDAHPPQPLAPGEPGLLQDMVVLTPEGRGAAWPYGVDWYRDTYPKPHWVAQRERQEERERGGGGAAAPAAAGAAAAGGSGSSSGGSGGAAA